MANVKELMVELAPPHLTDESAETIRAHLEDARNQDAESFDKHAEHIAEKITDLLPPDMSREEVAVASEGIARQVGFTEPHFGVSVAEAYINRYYSVGGM